MKYLDAIYAYIVLIIVCIALAFAHVFEEVYKWLNKGDYNKDDDNYPQYRK